LDVVPIHFHKEVLMAKRFPRTESDIATLAGRVIDGLTNAAEDFPAPPVSSEELRGKLDAFQAADTATVAAETAFRNQHAEKDEALEELVDAVKADLRYAEVAVRDGPGTSLSSRRATPGLSCGGSPPRTVARPRSTGSSGGRKARPGKTPVPRLTPSSS
jgi:hypothetical protein